jgi:hypothetical protein
MKRKYIVILFAVMVCVGLAGVAAAQSNGPNAPDVAVTTKFTYQGQIERLGALFDGACNMRFTLWDAAAAGMQQASYAVPAPVTVSDGVFAVEVDFGAQFKGDARWIQPETQCADDAGYQNLPRVALNPAPYAIGLMPGAQMEGSIAGTAGILRASNTGEGAALVGLATSATGTTFGVLGNAYSPNGYAVWGYANGGATGVRGFSASTGAGVWGSSASGAGVYGESTNFNGVRGIAHNINHGAVVGVHQGGGIGVYGLSTTNVGAYGESASGWGVYGKSQSSVGAYGQSTSSWGVYGLSQSSIGVYGESTNFEGVRGISHNADHGGVVGVNDAAGGTAVYGIATNGGYAAWFNGRTKTNVMEITGGADLAERFNVSEATAEPGTLMIIDETNPGHLTISRSAYDTKVAGIVSGAGGVKPGLTLHQAGVMEGDTEVAIAGRVYVKAIDSSGPIEPGDLLTTSDVPGYAMKATDRDRAQGAVIGKAMTGLDSGTGLVLVLVNLQ